MSASVGGPQLGYCHTCDHQVTIDPVSFECNQCHGGFVEIFNIEPQQRSDDGGGGGTATGAGAGAFDSSPRYIRLNNQNFDEMLPLVFHMLNSAAPVGGSDTNDRPSTNSTTPFSQFGSPSSVDPNYMQPPRPSRTRFQLILPTRPNEVGQDQFDLYGIINNVINDLLDPRRAQAGGTNTFHFQTPPIRIINLHSDARDYVWGAGGLDAIITQLLNQLENTGPPPASADQLHNLPIITIMQEHVDTNTQCAICMEDFTLDEKVKKLPCKHLFHEPCITEWLRLHGTCPVCRKNLNGEDTSQREYISRPPMQTSSPSAAATANSDSDATASSSNQESPRIEATSSGNRPTSRDDHDRNNSNQFYDPDFD